MTEQTQETPKAFVDFSEALDNIIQQHTDVSIVATAVQGESLSRFIHAKNGIMEAIHVLMETMSIVFQEMDGGNTNQTVLTCILAVLQNAKPEEETMEAKAVHELLTFITTNKTISSLVQEYKGHTDGSDDENA